MKTKNEIKEILIFGKTIIIKFKDNSIRIVEKLSKKITADSLNFSDPDLNITPRSISDNDHFSGGLHNKPN